MKTCLLFVVLLGCILLPAKAQKTSSLSRPNIVLISADDLGWSDIACYGSEIHTPNLDRLAFEGMRFTNFHNTSKCFPSRACLLTGVYAQQCNYHKHYNRPLTHAVTLGEVLRSAGYRTLWSGKHHGAENPVTRGFDHYYGLRDGCCNYFNPGNQRAGEGAPARKRSGGHKRQRAWCIDSTLYVPYTPAEKDFYTTDYFTHYALRWLDEYQNEERPFFLYLAYTAPHDPLMAWPEDIARYRGQYDAGYETIRKSRYERQKQLRLIDDTYQLTSASHTPWKDLSKTQQAEEAKKMEVYAAMIDRMDQNIGRVLQKLEEMGKLQNTLILFVSDNGASAEMVNIGDDYGEIGSMTRWTSLGRNWANVCNTPFRYYKNYSYEGGINTPFIAWWPYKIKPGTITRFTGHFIDIMPTLVEIAGAKYPTELNGEKITPMQGQSLLPVFEGKTRKRRQPLFWEWNKGQAAWSVGYKIVKHGLDKPFELYYLPDDPTESRNLADKHPKQVKKLEQLFENWKASLPHFD